MKYLIHVLLVISLLFIVSCNDVVIEADINPEFQSYSGTVAIKFQLGTLTVLDEWEELKPSQFLYLTDKATEKKVHLIINASDYNPMKFYYVINDSIKIESKEAVGWEILMKHIDSFPNVRWTQKDGVTIAEKNQVTITPGGPKPFLSKENPQGKKL